MLSRISDNVTDVPGYGTGAGKVLAPRPEPPDAEKNAHPVWPKINL